MWLIVVSTARTTRSGDWVERIGGEKRGNYKSSGGLDRLMTERANVSLTIPRLDLEIGDKCKRARWLEPIVSSQKNGLGIGTWSFILDAARWI